MKILLIILLLIILILMTNLQIRVTKINNKNIELYIIIFKIIPLKFKLKEINLSQIDNIKINNIIKANKELINKTHILLIKNILKTFDGKTIYFSINTSYYIYNLASYLTTFYIYSFIQNLLYMNLNKIRRSCFKSRIKNTKANLEIDIVLETKFYKLLIVLLQNIKLIKRIYKERKYEQSSNRRIIKNIDVKY